MGETTFTWFDDKVTFVIITDDAAHLKPRGKNSSFLPRHIGYYYTSNPITMGTTLPKCYALA